MNTKTIKISVDVYNIVKRVADKHSWSLRQAGDTLVRYGWQREQKYSDGGRVTVTSLGSKPKKFIPKRNLFWDTLIANLGFWE